MESGNHHPVCARERSPPLQQTPRDRLSIWVAEASGETLPPSKLVPLLGHQPAFQLVESAGMQRIGGRIADGSPLRATRLLQSCRWRNHGGASDRSLPLRFEHIEVVRGDLHVFITRSLSGTDGLSPATSRKRGEIERNDFVVRGILKGEADRACFDAGHNLSRHRTCRRSSANARRDASPRRAAR